MEKQPKKVMPLKKAIGEISRLKFSEEHKKAARKQSWII